MILLLACVQPDDDKTTKEPDTTEPMPGVTVTTYEATSDGDGYVEVPIEVDADVDVFQVVVKRDTDYVSTDYIYGPDDALVLDWEDWYDSSFSLTACFYPTEFATTANWPVRAEDGPLTEGTWKVAVSTLNARYGYVGNKTVQVEVLTRKDDDFGAGNLRALVAYATGVRDEDGVVDAMEGAVDYWKEIYADVGITLTAEYTDIEVDPQLPDTYEGLDAIRELYAAQGERVVLLVIGEDIGGDATVYGEAGGIPGPYSAANHAAVEISWLAGAGTDGAFSESDILLMGETLGHEVGHYMGLFHPVEDGYQYWDALDDTDECGSWTGCDTALGTNLMYPYPVCEGWSTNTCVRQSRITPDQSGVINRYVGVEQ